MTVRGNGWGGARPGSGRPSGSTNRSYGDLVEAAKRELATGKAAGVYRTPSSDICAHMGLGPTRQGQTPAAALAPALHRLFADTRADLDTRLRRIEQNGIDHGKRLDEAIETLERVLRHQLGIARQVGAIETPKAPRVTRARPMS
jgi:hypothetical protein